MVVGEFTEEVDLLVVGGGPGGYTAALRAAELGRRVTLVDEAGAAGLGGACLHVGCIPSKALIEVAGHAWRGRELAALGAGGGDFDAARFQAGKRELVTGLAAGVEGQLQAAGVTVLAGRAAFVDPTTVAVRSAQAGNALLRFRDAILATGSRPAELAGLPRDGETVLDSTDALALERVPASLAVVGGGYIGVELGIAFAKLGARVAIVEARERMLAELPRCFERPLRKRLEEIGVAVHLEASAGSHADGVLHCEVGGEELEIEAELVVVAVGRAPNLAALELPAAGLGTGTAGLLEPDPDRRLAEHLAAIGDLVPGPALAHKASAEARVAAEALSGRRVAFEPAAIPLVVFADPELASAGLSREAARELGIDAIEAVVPLAASGRAAAAGARHGSVAIVADRDADAVIGAHIAAPHASELIAEAVLAIELAASPEDLALSVHAHPTLSELLGDAAARMPVTSADRRRSADSSR